MHEVRVSKGWVSCWGPHQKGNKAAEKTLGKLKRLKKGSRINIQKYRVAQRQAKHKDEEQQQQKEGTTYCASAFNDLTVVTEPARKRKKK